MKRSLGVAVALSLGLGMSGLRAEEAAKPDAEKVDKGQQIYTAQHCSMCHSIAGKGNPKTPLDDVGSKMKVDEMKKYIASPKSVKADSKMKAYSSLPAADLDALVAYLQTLTKKGS
jgi:mono/diheme cytochrome c family protein